MNASCPAAEKYEQVFATLGFPLSPLTTLPDAAILAAEARLGVRIPAPLRCYYTVAGNEKVLNRAHNRLLLPSEWFVSNGRLAFMEENQAVVYWGVDATSDCSDPVVYQACNGEPATWRKEHDSLVTFLVVMLHWQATVGGAMPYTNSARVSSALKSELESSFDYAGEINGMHAFNAQGRAVCYLSWASAHDRRNSWRLFAGATTQRGLQDIREMLDVDWESV